jgi:predicted ATPase
MARSAMAEAATQLAEALELLAGLPTGPDRDRRERDLQVALGGALVATKGFAAPEVGKAYGRARELCGREADDPLLLAALSGLFLHQFHTSGVGRAFEIAKELLRSAERQRDAAAQAMGHRCSAACLMFHGQLAAAWTHIEQALALYGRADRTAEVFLSTSDTRVACLNFLPLVLLWQGYPDQALARSREGLIAADELNHAYTSSHVLHLNCWLHQARGEPRVVRERAGTMMALTAKHGFPFWSACAAVFHGWALAAEGQLAAGITQMCGGLAANRATGVQLQLPHFLGLIAEVHMRAGSPTEALPLLAEAVAVVGTIETRWCEAELRRLEGEALLALSPERSGEAEACYLQALAVARGQGARHWELRAATSLARLWRDQGRDVQARDLLTPVYGWFTEGFDTADLQDAKALLGTLA